MLPADQRLQRMHPVGPEADLRLVVQDQLILCQRPPQLGHERDGAGIESTEVARVLHDAAVLGPCGPERLLGGPHQIVGRGSVVRRGRPTDRQTGTHRNTVQLDVCLGRASERLQASAGLVDR